MNKYTQKEIRVVQRLIERCLTFYLTREEAISTLYSYEPHFVRLVWQKLEEQNPEFFKAYQIRLTLKRQIVLFNELISQQAASMRLQGTNPGMYQQPSSSSSLQTTSYPINQHGPSLQQPNPLLTQQQRINPQLTTQPTIQAYSQMTRSSPIPIDQFQQQQQHFVYTQQPEMTDMNLLRKQMFTHSNGTGDSNGQHHQYTPSEQDLSFMQRIGLQQGNIQTVQQDLNILDPQLVQQTTNPPDQKIQRKSSLQSESQFNVIQQQQGTTMGSSHLGHSHLGPSHDQQDQYRITNTTQQTFYTSQQTSSSNTSQLDQQQSLSQLPLENDDSQLNDLLSGNKKEFYDDFAGVSDNLFQGGDGETNTDGLFHSGSNFFD